MTQVWRSYSQRIAHAKMVQQAAMQFGTGPDCLPVELTAGRDPAGPSWGWEEWGVGLLRAVVRAISFRACSGDVGPLLTLDHCRHINKT